MSGAIREPLSESNEGAVTSKVYVSDVVDDPAEPDVSYTHGAEIQVRITGEEGHLVGSPLGRNEYGPDDNVFLRLAEGDHEGDWFKAIEEKDCLELSHILERIEDGSSFSKCLETGLKNRTALHVAAMQGSFYLAKQVIDIVIANGSSACEYIDHVDGRSGLIAYEMACTIIGHTSIALYIRDNHKYCKRYDEVLYPQRTRDRTYNFNISCRKYIACDTSDHDFRRDPSSGTYEAYSDTDWCTALRYGNCDRLFTLLRTDSRYLFQTCYGLSVLDVAIIMHEAELVDYINNAFGIEDETIHWPEKFYYPFKLSLVEFRTHRYRQWKRFVQGPPTKRLIQRRIQDSNLNDDSDQLSAENLEEMFNNYAIGKNKEVKPIQRLIVPEDEIFLRGLVKAGLLIPVDSGKVEPSEYRYSLPEFEFLMSLAKTTETACGKCSVDEFKADVDFNFEDRTSLRFSILRAHYALKGSTANFSAQQRKDIIRLFSSYGGIRSIYDGQGRGPHDVLIDHYHAESDIFTNTFYGQTYFHTVDVRGRSSILRCVTKQFLGTVPDILGALSARFAFFWVWRTDLHEYFQQYSRVYELALTLQNERVLRSMFVDTIKDCSIFPDGYLLQVAATGNEVILQMFMRKINDPMIVDSNGCTALHYAVDSDMYEFSCPRAAICSVDDYCMVKEQWRKKYKGEPSLTENQTVVEKSPTSRQHVYAGRKACILMLQQAGVDLQQANDRGNIPDPGTLSDASFRSWWYELLVKDTTEKKNSFNQAGNALSVVGTLVAATSYIGPLQPPLSYSDNLHVDTSKSAVKVFMWTNTLAFYMAIASVMFAVVPSLPMPQEGAIEELRRAQHMVSTSLVLLMASIACILVYAAATAAVVDTEEFHGGSNFLLSPSLIGWIFCLVAMTGFFIRVMRLVFYKNVLVRRVYKFSFTMFCRKVLRLTV